MILTCPECATSYFVDDARVPAAGRTVKCSSCGISWKAMRPEPQLVAAAFEAPPKPPPEPAPTFEPEAPPQVVAAAAPDDDLEFVPSESPARAAAKARAKAATTKAPKARRGPLIGLSAAAGLALAAIAGAGIFRDQIVELAPPTAAAFTAAGLPVNETGLVIEQVKSQAAFQGGRPVLSITGAIRNLRQETAHSPAIRVSLTDKEGRPLAAKLVRPLNGEIPAGSKRYFAISMADPPSGSHDLEVAFEDAAANVPAHGPAAAAAHGVAPAHAAEVHHTPTAAPHVAPEDAKPLPPGSPDALPEHHG